MTSVSHKRAAGPRQARALEVQALIESSARRLQRAGVFYGHGTDNAWDEAAALVWHALRLPRSVRPGHYRRRVSAAGVQRCRDLIDRRIKERIPAAYLTGETSFAGLWFKVDPRVLIPRSPFAELIETRFRPWIDPQRVRSILDLGTGSGCIAIGAANAFPRARVTATDLSKAALEVAAENVRRHRLTRRVHLVESDHFSALGTASYDMILSNPPYVSAREMRALPGEYRHEPAVALASGRDGLDSVRIILREARQHLRPRGILVVEVGNSEHRVRRAFRSLPFTWLQFERGGSGVFLLTAEQLESGVL